jgi:predicted transcriptional regulator of viral defense system
MLGAMRGVTDIGQPSVDFRTEPPLDAAVAELAARQHGVVSLRQLQLLGLGKAAVAKRAKAGRLHRIHRSVYAVGHARLTAQGRWMAAVLACGPKAVLSHRSAAAHLGLLRSARAIPDVTLPSPGARARKGIEVHASGTLTAADVTVVDAIPCTTVARTFLDLAEVEKRRRVEIAIEQAEVQRVFDLRAVEDVLDRANGRRGAAVVRTVLAELAEPALTDRELEERFFALCNAAFVPRPEVNVWLTIDDGNPIKADFLWRAEKLVVETDGRASHGTRQAFESDRLRDQRLKLARYEVVHFTWRQVTDEPERVALTVKRLLVRSDCDLAGSI